MSESAPPTLVHAALFAIAAAVLALVVLLIGAR